MNNKNLRVLHIFLLLFCLIFMPINLFGYDSGKDGVHDKASQKAWDKAIREGDFLQDLGLTKDDVLYQGVGAKGWVALGSRYEDGETFIGIVRTVNHFYDPTKKIGLNDPCGFPAGTGLPSPSWGLGYVPLLNKWDIKNAREYEYIALTGKDLDGSAVSDAQDDNGRKKYFAHMFRAVGQVMHLIEDSAVPEHVRNDGHALPGDRSLYEAYAATNKDLLHYDDMDYKYPLVKFSDYYCYFDTSLSACGMANGGMGIAEFTNRNFVSQSTNFDDRGLCRQVAGIYSQPQPEFSNVEQETVPLPGGGTKTFYVHYAGNMVSDYYTGTPPEANKFLSAYSWWDFEKKKEFNERVYSLNDKCFKAAADFVVHRAVGYSAGLLDYFFRGKIKLTLSEDAINHDYITVRAQNTTENGEEMANGEIMLVMKYSRNGEIYYETSHTSTTSIPRDNTTVLVFPNVIPPDVSDFMLQAVYHGELGKEKEAVAVGSINVKRPIIAIYKNLGTEQEPRYDWWYYLVDTGEGFHDDPQASFPSAPEILTTWWSCEQLEEVEYYTRVSPAFQNPTRGGAGDNCGLVNFKSGQCCEGSSSSPNTQEDWVVLPCGGEPGYIGWWYGMGGKHVSSCSECGDGQETMWTPGAQSTRSRTSNKSSHCDKGTSWDLSIGQLTEKMDIGPRTDTSGYESSSIASASNVHCGPYEKARMCSPVCSQDRCQYTWMWLPAFCGTVCESNFSCEGWHPAEPQPQWTQCINKTFSGTDTYGAQHGSNYQGCALFDIASRSSGYGTMAADVVTKVKVGAVETTFGGSWSSYSAQEGNESVNNVQRGWTTQCLSCPQGSGQGATHKAAHFSFSETSYGVAGWSTVVASDGKFAVLIPKMNLSATATSTDGSASGGISSTTTALLRIVDGSELNFDLAQADTKYALNGIPGSRDDLGIKPNCWPRDLPLDIELRGLHWYSDDAFLVTFMLQDKFYAHLFKKQNGAWSGLQLVSFEEWVNNNALTGHVMFLK